MSAVELRSQVDKYLDQVDESFLRVVYSMLNTYTAEQRQQEEDPILGYDADGKAVHAREARAQFRAELEGVKRGEYKTIEDFAKESEAW